MKFCLNSVFLRENVDLFTILHSGVAHRRLDKLPFIQIRNGNASNVFSTLPSPGIITTGNQVGPTAEIPTPVKDNGCKLPNHCKIDRFKILTVSDPSNNSEEFS
ncbi:hypothetical protein TNCT_532341 [Trichonephila clavata]|uniref:Uncharacterized protein n=1 Tax=Trichonephila clavata TaxID=2740835 RepID=A0A8X6G230_TRICU|nr:hypothetical protein TNCT_532341 [Trichonephila clavata]